MIHIPSEYEAFVRSRWPQAVRTCWLILRNVQDAEEAAQDAFYNLYRYHHQIRNPEKWQAWFYTTLIHAAHQRYRRRKRLTLADHGEICDTVDPIQQADTRLSVEAALYQLSELERIAIVLCYYCDLTDRQAAPIAGWSLGTYKWRLAKAKRKLKDILQADEHDLTESLDKERGSAWRTI